MFFDVQNRSACYTDYYYFNKLVNELISYVFKKVP